MKIGEYAMKHKMIAQVKYLRTNTEGCNNIKIKELQLSEEELMTFLKNILPLVMEDIRDPDIRGKSPDKYIMNLMSNKLGDFSQRIILTYEQESSAVGILIALPNATMQCFHILTFGVLKGFRGKGIGKALLHRLGDILIARNIKQVKLDVHELNVDAIRLYESVGFMKV